MYRDAVELAKTGNIYDIEPTILVPHLRNLKQIAVDHLQLFNDTDSRGIWVYGEPGSGKSHWARSFADTIGTVYSKPLNKWWDGYIGQQVVILDDLDNDCLSHHIKIWADKYACTGETKGGTISLRHTHFIITSNFTIAHCFIRLPGVT